MRMIRRLHGLANSLRALARGRLTARKRPGVVVLMYHSIRAPGDPATAPFNIVAPQQFARQVAQLARRYRVVALDTLVQELQNRSLPPGRTVVVTFDDGYRDNVLTALPALRAHHIPACFFLTTDWIDRRAPKWDDTLSAVLMTIPGAALRVDIAGRPLDVALGSVEQRLQSYLTLLRSLRGLDPQSRALVLDDLIEQHRQRASQPLSVSEPMQWQEARELLDAGMQLGAHTLGHLSLAALSPDEARRQVDESRSVIERQTSCTVTSFSYPFGKHQDVTPQVRSMIEALGFQAAVTTNQGVNRIGADPLLLQRYAVGPDDTLLHWELKLLGE
jgi:peptidoglycan/xylan/chitin deacetylase (PgdA/CDA1 family)